MPRKPPRYDLPKAAPEPLRLVQLFVNTRDVSHEREWLAEWFAARGFGGAGRAELARARALREAVRELLYANNGQGSASAEASAVLGAAADAAALTIDFEATALRVRATGLDRALGEVAAACFAGMQAGSWSRLKCCRNHECRWAFYDYSKNRSASWCSMQICGNRTKTRSYRARGRTSPEG